MSEQPTPPEWVAWELGVGRCPYCAGLEPDDFEAICDCFQFQREFPEMAARPWPDNSMFDDTPFEEAAPPMKQAPKPAKQTSGE